METPLEKPSPETSMEVEKVQTLSAPASPTESAREVLITWEEIQKSYNGGVRTMIGTRSNVYANSGTTQGGDMSIPSSYLVDYLNYMNDALWKLYKFLHDLQCIADIDPSKLPSGAIDDDGKLNPDLLKTENGNPVIPLEAPPR